MTSLTTPPLGIDVDRVTTWFEEQVPEVVAPLAFELVAGGLSNLTYRVTDGAGRPLVLRRPPVGPVLPTAHDMSREYRILHALGPTAVPVPRVFGLCEDEEVSGRPFYVMELVEGHILRGEAAAKSLFSESGRWAIGEHLADTLAAMHAVNVEDVGLGDLGRPNGYIERQLRRWSRQLAEAPLSGTDTNDLIEEVGSALASDIPDQKSMTIVHGDYRLDNVMVADDSTINAVLDWEICTLGDPMADVGLLMVYWSEPGDGEPLLQSAAASRAPGFPSRQAMLERYATTSGRDVSDVAYFVAFGYWKLACILHGVSARYVAGTRAGDPDGVDPRTIDRLARLASDTLADR